MGNIIRNSQRIGYGIKKFVVDTVEDIKNIPLLSTTLPGSTVFVTSNSSQYILNKNYSWVKINTSSAGVGGDDSAGGGEDEGPDGGNTPSDDEIVYDGTEI